MAVQLKFRYLDGDQFESDGQSSQVVSLNGTQFQSNTNTFRSVFDVSKTDSAKVHVAVKTFFDEQSKAAHSSAQDSDSHNEEYLIDSAGVYQVDPKSDFPVTRSIPTFPSQDLEVHETWNAKGIEMVDLSGIGVFSQNKKPIPAQLVEFPVNYQYQGVVTRNGRDLDVIDLEYDISHRPGLSNRDFRIYPTLLSGTTHETIYFDRTLGLVVSYSENYRLDLVLSNGDLYEFTGTTQGDFKPISLKERSPLVEQVKLVQLPTTPVALVQKKPSPDQQSPLGGGNFWLKLDSIIFSANSAVLLPSEMKKLDSLALNMKKYPKADLLIEGFTENAGTRNQRRSLSEQRAETVGNYLCQKGVITKEEMITVGLGARNPLVPKGSISAGLDMNRRVELILLANALTVSAPQSNDDVK